MRSTAMLLALAIAACATPEVAEKYEERSWVPEELAAALGSDDPAVRADASKQIRGMEPDRRKVVLLELSRDERAAVRLMAVSGLGEHDPLDAQVIDRLTEVLSLDPDPDVRFVAVSGLAAGATADGMRALATALVDDGHVDVVVAAALALDEITGQDFAAAAADGLVGAIGDMEEAAILYEDWIDEHAAGGRR